MKNVTAALEKQYPGSNTGNSATIIPLMENYVSDIRRALYALFGAVGFVLLIACANVAGLALARAATRRRATTLKRFASLCCAGVGSTIATTALISAWKT